MRLTRSLLTLGACSALIAAVALGGPRRAAADCGDGVTTVGEQCDDGTPSCGLGSKKAGSECNKEADCGGVAGVTSFCSCSNATSSCTNTVGNRDDVPNACRSNCMLFMCGDGVSDGNEQCDNGANNGLNKPCLGPHSRCGGLATGKVCTTNGDCAGTGTKCLPVIGCINAVCGDGLVCSDPSCSTGPANVQQVLAGGSATTGPEQCDDQNSSDTDNCTSAGYSVPLPNGLTSIPDACALPSCGDGITNGSEQCDAGTALCSTGVNIDKPCKTDKDCSSGNVAGTCSTGNRDDVQSIPNPATCRSTCNIASCGDGVSDSGLGEGCDDGNTVTGPGDYCESVRRCIGGENGCADTITKGVCDPGSAAGDVCTKASDCIKGTCGQVQCVQNICGDGIVAGNEQCDDGNTVNAGSTDSCGVSAATAAGRDFLAGCVAPKSDTDPTDHSDENLKGRCPAANCQLPSCGDGVTNPSEMCDAGTATCSTTNTYNGGAPCVRATDCKNHVGVPADQCVCPAGPAGCNRDDLPDHCRPTCMPAACGDGISDTNEQCDLGAGNGATKPCIDSLTCNKANTSGALSTNSPCNGLAVGTVLKCILATCGDGLVCSDPTCTTGPSLLCKGGTRNGQECTTVADCPPVAAEATFCEGTNPEQCDDGNTVDASTIATDTCSTHTPGAPPANELGCAGPVCGDGITNPNEQCDNTAMGCSRMDPKLNDCCYTGNVVNTDKSDNANGLITVEQAMRALLDCRMPHLISTAACDSRLAKLYQRIDNSILTAETRLENNDVTGARRTMNSVALRLARATRRLTRVTQAGKSCSGTSLSAQNGNATNLSAGVVAHLVQNNPGFGN